MSDYANTAVGLVSATGGAVRVTIASNVGQGNGGTSLPCKEVLVAQGATSLAISVPVRMNIGVAATSILGINLPGLGYGATMSSFISDQSSVPPPLRLAIDDVSKLYFWASADSEVVDILYRR